MQAWINEKRTHLKVLLKYLDKDYSQTKKRQVLICVETQCDDVLTIFCKKSLSLAEERIDYLRPSVGSLEAKHAGLYDDLWLG